jgi:hypothetical protein
VLSWDWSKAGRCSTATAIVAALVRCRALGFTETVGVVVVAVLGRMSAVRLVVLFQVSSFGSKKKKRGISYRSNQFWASTHFGVGFNLEVLLWALC